MIVIGVEKNWEHWDLGFICYFLFSINWLLPETFVVWSPVDCFVPYVWADLWINQKLFMTIFVTKFFDGETEDNHWHFTWL